MPRQNRIPPELRQAVFRYLSERLEIPLISTGEAVRTVREQMPESAVVSDRELADSIAAIAVEAGFGVNFDGTETIQ